MILVSSRAQLSSSLVGLRESGQRLGLVPTMGNIHNGHLQLIKTAQAHADFTAVTIFVNPTQFDQADDFNHYPRTLDDDLQQLKAAGADLVFTPQVTQIYPLGDLQAHIDTPTAAAGLEGAHRSGHFRGVATVVCKLFNLLQPDIAVFGKKDYQQLAVIRAMVDELFMPVKIIADETLRDPDGLAMSSRNSRLTTEQRTLAATLYSTLQQSARAIANGRNYDFIENTAAEALKNSGFNVDYVAIRDQFLNIPAPDTLQLVILAAATLGKVRLIDNMEIDIDH